MANSELGPIGNFVEQLNNIDGRLKIIEAKMALFDARLGHIENQQLQKSIFELRDKIKEMDLSNAPCPEWINSNRACQILNIKDAETLNKYADLGLIEKEKGADNKNYYRTKDVFELPVRLIGFKKVKK